MVESDKPIHTCPWWLGHLLASPLRRLIENPDTLVVPLVKPGDRVLELGPAMGFFTLPTARAVGPAGKVVCVEVQRSMLESLGRKLSRAGLSERAQLRQCSHQDLGLAELEGSFDLALAIHVVHETIAPEATVIALARSLKPGGRLLLIEPPGHCSADVFEAEVAAAEREGMVALEHPRPGRRRRNMLRLWRKQ